jgi:nucleotide-binding universal stress UspA family protein
MFSPRRMLFPVDFSQPSEAMAPRVAAVARHFHAGVTLLHVLPTNPVDEHRRLAQEDLSAFGWPYFTGMSTAQAIVEGDPAEAILKYAREQKIDLIMMPTHGFGPFRRFLLGSVTEKVLRDAKCPVWTDAHSEIHKGAPGTEVVSAGADDMLPVKNVVCAVDLSEESQPALKWAADFAADASAKLTIVHAIARSLPTPELPVDWTPQLEEAAREQLAKLQQAVGTHAETRVITGEVAHALHDAVEDVHGDLLVIGRRPDGGGWAHVMDHAYPIVRNAPCPVVSV